MIHFEGDRSFSQPVADVAAKLSDVAFLAACVPDFQAKEVSADRATGKLKPKLSFVTGSLDATITVTERDPGKVVAFAIASKGIGMGSTVVTRLVFAEAPNGGTAVHWTGDVTEVTGMLKMVPKGLMQGTAEKVIEDMWKSIDQKLAAG